MRKRDQLKLEKDQNEISNLFKPIINETESIKNSRNYGVKTLSERLYHEADNRGIKREEYKRKLANEEYINLSFVPEIDKFSNAIANKK